MNTFKIAVQGPMKDDKEGIIHIIDLLSCNHDGAFTRSYIVKTGDMAEAIKSALGYALIYELETSGDKVPSNAGEPNAEVRAPGVLPEGQDLATGQT